MTLLRLISLVCLLPAFARADVRLAPLFQDHAIIQRDTPIVVWGWAEPGEKVSVAFRGSAAATQTGTDGRWRVSLESLAASHESADLIVDGRNRVVVRDIVVGEVWLASGQSNMEWTVARSLNATAEIAAAKNTPTIRHFKVARAVSDSPTHHLQGKWQKASPETAGEFSAVGYYFARQLSARLGVPIGIINTTWGGRQVECWLTPEELRRPEFAFVNERWQADLAAYPARKALHDKAVAQWEIEMAASAAQSSARPRPLPPPGPGHQNTPGGLFNAMVYPIVPYAIRGVIWYQGEANTPRPGEYGALFAAMIRSWRTQWAQDALPFYWAQLANWIDRSDRSGTAWARLREAQSQTLNLPHTGQAIAIDIGDPLDIHPLNKQEVGGRLAAIALHHVHGADEAWSGPIFADAKPEGRAMRVTFQHASAGLVTRGATVSSLEVAGADRVFHPALASLDGRSLLASSSQVIVPVAVRYAWSNSPVANLYNAEGLPAAPFRSDNW